MHRLMPKSIVFTFLIIPTFLFAGVYGLYDMGCQIKKFGYDNRRL